MLHPVADLAAPAGLPQRLTSFLGREAELDQLAALLAANRLITVTGPGGTGKTSLVIELARREAARFPDGVWFVALDSLADASQVASTVADYLGLIAAADRDLGEQLADFLRDRSALLVTDNFEHVLDAAPLIVDLLHAAPSLRVVVTSRTALLISGEQQFPVMPLAMPEAADSVSVALKAPAIRLFVDRARRVDPSFELRGGELDAVIDICRRLDGLPLAIELAAARVGRLPLAAIGDLLGRRLELPGRAARDVPERQRTLGGAVAWSYDLLDPSTRTLLARLSVFAGGFSVDAAELVCDLDEEGPVIVDRLTNLIENSLAEAVPGPDAGRVRLLETIRLFAGERLAERDEAAEVRRRHALYHLALAEDAADHLPGRDQPAWLDRLAADLDNLRAAIRWALDTGEVEVALRFVAALWRFWQLRGLLHEGRATADSILAMSADEEPSVLRVRALDAAGGLAWWSSDVPRADASYAAALEMARRIGDLKGAADALLNLHWSRFALNAGDTELDQLREQAVRLYEEIGDTRSIPRARMTRGFVLLRARRADAAEAELLGLYDQFGSADDTYYAGLTADALSSIALEKGDFDRALEWQARAIRGWLAMGDLARTIAALRSAAILLLAAGLPGDGATVYAAFDALSRRHGIRPAIALEDWVSFGWTREAALAELTSRAYVEEARLGASLEVTAAADRFQAAVESRQAGSGGPVMVAAAAAAGDPGTATGPLEDRFVREGEVWAITYDGRTIRLKDTKGLRYLASLLASPGREIPAIDLAADDQGGSGAASGAASTALDADLSMQAAVPDALLDAAARAAYKARLLELKEQIDENEGLDSERVSRLREEFDFIVGELTAATGLGGRDRGSTGPGERARQSVTKAIRASMDRIAREHSALGAHLEHAVRTGVMCTYAPDARAAPRWVTG
jgi:predicted ATPase